MNVEELILESNHDSVTKERLTKLKGGLTAQYLFDKPLIEYLDEDENPHFILFARTKPPVFSGATPSALSDRSPDGMAMHLLTDKRWIIVIGLDDGDESFDIPWENVLEVDISTGISKHKITLITNDHHIEIPIRNKFDSDDIKDAKKYIQKVKSAENDSSRSDEQSAEIDSSKSDEQSAENDSSKSDQQSLKELRESGIGTQQLATEMVKRAEDDSVTTSIYAIVHHEW